MSELQHEIARLLNTAGYSTEQSPRFSLLFEDESLMGFISEYDRVETLLEKWHTDQQDFLKINASHFSQHPTKSWNVYVVLITADKADQSQRAELRRIEEDLRGTRKIARDSVDSPKKAVTALLPILPIQSSAGTIQPGDFHTQLATGLDLDSSIMELIRSGSTAEELLSRIGATNGED